MAASSAPSCPPIIGSSPESVIEVGALWNRGRESLMHPILWGAVYSSKGMDARRNVSAKTIGIDGPSSARFPLHYVANHAIGVLRIDVAAVVCLRRVLYSHDRVSPDEHARRKP